MKTKQTLQIDELGRDGYEPTTIPTNDFEKELLRIVIESKLVKTFTAHDYYAEITLNQKETTTVDFELDTVKYLNYEWFRVTYRESNVQFDRLFEQVYIYGKARVINSSGNVQVEWNFPEIKEGKFQMNEQNNVADYPPVVEWLNQNK